MVWLLAKNPEWYIIDICGVIGSVGSIAVLGISLNIFLVIVLLIGLATYDVISVHVTKHMIDLADVALDLKLPVMLVVPTVKSYSFKNDKKRLSEKSREEGKREAFFIGLGDIVMPGILIASTFHNITSGGLAIALSVITGTLVGFILLAVVVAKGKPQPGLPYLCSGAILGYLASSYILFGNLTGLTFPI
jgi:presenilin-like A22 family membrane protease